MEYFEFLKYHDDRKQIHTLYNAQFWISCVYLTENNTLIKNTPPLKVEFEVDPVNLDIHRRPIIDIFKVNANGERLKSTVSYRDSGNNHIHVFQTHLEARNNYNAMLDDIQNEIKFRRLKKNQQFDTVTDKVNDQYI